jgi:hypothetical protein
LKVRELTSNIKLRTSIHNKMEVLLEIEWVETMKLQQA